MRTLVEMTHSQVAMGAQASGTSNVTGSSAVTMDGWEGAMFIFHMGTIAANAVTTAKVQGRDDSGEAWTDLDGVTLSIPDNGDGQSFVIDCFRPQKRQLRAAVDRGTAGAVIASVIALLYNPRYSGSAGADGSTKRVSYATT